MAQTVSLPAVLLLIALLVTCSSDSSNSPAPAGAYGNRALSLVYDAGTCGSGISTVCLVDSFGLFSYAPPSGPTRPFMLTPEQYTSLFTAIDTLHLDSLRSRCVPRPACIAPGICPTVSTLTLYSDTSMVFTDYSVCRDSCSAYVSALDSVAALLHRMYITHFVVPG